MPKTIKECLEELASHVEHEHAIISRIPNDLVNTTVYIKAIDDHVDTALAEIRQLLKEAEPKKLKESDYVLNMGVMTNPPSNTTRTNLTRKGYNSAIEQYTANIEKRLR